MSETVNKSRSGIAFLAIFLSLVSVGSSGYLYYLGMQYKLTSNNKIEKLTEENLNLKRLNTEEAKQIKASIDSIEAKIVEISGNKSGLFLFQINELISLANQGLLIYGDINGCTRLLNSAKSMLEENNDPSLTGLKFAISSDITRLEGLPKIDKVSLNGDLDGLIDQVSYLHIAMESAQNEKSNDNQSQSKWDLFAENIKVSLLNLISIKKSSDANVPLPRQEEVLEENIRVDLLSSRIALIQNDAASWLYGLNGAKKIINTYFANYKGINEINLKLDGLINIDISNNNANINSTLEQLNKLNKLQN